MTDDELTAAERNGLLFICVDNGIRSQMAEAFARFIGPAEISYFSAGAWAGPELPEPAIKAMKEVGVNVTHARPKTLDDIPMATIATVISLCPPGDCPSLPAGVHHLSWPLPDPLSGAGSEREIVQRIREVRDQIRELVSRLF